jgi:predicted amidophosphoribosyltransferase
MKDIAAQNLSAHEGDPVFVGLAWCDQCGAHLEPGEEMSGLCGACARASRKRPPPRRRGRRPRADQD